MAADQVESTSIVGTDSLLDSRSLFLIPFLSSECDAGSESGKIEVCLPKTLTVVREH